MFRCALSIALSAVFVVSGCSAKKRVAPVAPPPSAPEGKSSYTYIFDPANPALHLQADVQFVRPEPVDTKALPIYPERALAAQDGTHRELVRIVIDTHGSVGQVLDSPVGRSDGGPFAEDYRRAVEAAVRTWRFQSGGFMHFAGGPDKDGDGKPDYKLMTTSEKVAVYYDIRFTFEILAGQGTVRVTP